MFLFEGVSFGKRASQFLKGGLGVSSSQTLKKKQKTPILAESWINFPCFGVKHVNSLTKRVFFIEIFTK